MGRDDDGHVARRQRLEPLDELSFAANVKMRGGLVEKQHFGLPDEDAGKSDRLFLAARQAAPALRDRHLVAQRMTGDETFNAGKPRGRHYFCICRFRLAKRDVVAQLAEE